MRRVVAPNPISRIASVLALCVGIQAQDPAFDDPWRVIELPVEGAAVTVQVEDPEVPRLLGRGFALLGSGWDWEARRVFKQATSRVPSQPTAYLGLSLASRNHPRLAAERVWDAGLRRRFGSPAEAAAIEAYLRYYRIETRPLPVEERYDTAPDAVRHRILCQDLVAILEQQDGDEVPVVQALLAYERGSGSRAALDDRALRTALVEAGEMPFLVPGFPGGFTTATGGSEALPRHPFHPGRDDARSAGDAPVTWQPRPAPGFDLVRGLGGRSRMEDYAGKPMLVVFFLGFGCVHCVAQLDELDPQTQRFWDAGIQVVSIGTDSADQVKAARITALENGTDPLQFDVLSDPDGEAFKAWHAWDDFEDEALHGTYLVDPKGRILWQDISTQPFMDTEFLLAECLRLLEIWK